MLLIYMQMTPFDLRNSPRVRIRKKNRKTCQKSVRVYAGVNFVGVHDHRGVLETLSYETKGQNQT